MRNDTLSRWARAAVWALPVYGALTLAATLSQQPDPTTRFQAWSEYVTTSWFYASHIGASVFGLALGTLGVVGLGIVLAGGRRPRAALTAVALHVLGSAVVLGLFGVAAFVQPTIGAAFLGGEAAAEGWYDAVFGSARTLVPAATGLLLFSAASVVMAWSLAEHPGVPRWLAWLFGLTAPFVGILGLMVSVLQPLGSALLILSGALVAVRLRREPVGGENPAVALDAAGLGQREGTDHRSHPPVGIVQGAAAHRSGRRSAAIKARARRRTNPEKGPTTRQ